MGLRYEWPTGYARRCVTVDAPLSTRKPDRCHAGRGCD